MSLTRTGFQDFVNKQPAPAVVGDFADANPRMSMSAPPAGYIAGPAGVYVGRFAWGDPDTGIMTSFKQFRSLVGFVHRENQAIIVPFLQSNVLQVLAGLMVTAMTRGDFWAEFLGGGARGDTVYADAATGLAVADAAGSETQSIEFTATISAGGLMNVTIAGTGNIDVGMEVVGPGVPLGTFVESLGTGMGGVGTYNLNQGVPGGLLATVLSAYGLIDTGFKLATTVPVDAEFTGDIDATGKLHVTALASGSVDVGQFLDGDGVAPFTVITAQLDGTPGGVGHYQVNNFVVVASTALTGSGGKLGKITTWQG